jgi:hypothetical protein
MHPFCLIPRLTIPGQVAVHEAFLQSNLFYMKQFFVDKYLLKWNRIGFFGADADLRLSENILRHPFDLANEWKCTFISFHPELGDVPDCLFTSPCSLVPELTENGLYRQLRNKYKKQGWIFAFIIGQRLDNTIELCHLLSTESSLMIWLEIDDIEVLSKDLVKNWSFDDYFFQDEMIDLSKKMAGTTACRFSIN